MSKEISLSDLRQPFEKFIKDISELIEGTELIISCYGSMPMWLEIGKEGINQYSPIGGNLNSIEFKLEIVKRR